MAVSGILYFLKTDYMELNDSMIYPLTVNGFGTRSVSQQMTFSGGITAMNNPAVIPYIAGMAISTGNS